MFVRDHLVLSQFRSSLIDESHGELDTCVVGSSRHSSRESKTASKFWVHIVANRRRFAEGPCALLALGESAHEALIREVELGETSFELSRLEVLRADCLGH